MSQDVVASDMSEAEGDGQPNSPSKRAHARAGFVGAAVVVSSLTFLSRITGLFRDVYLAGAFGVSGVSDAFWTGFLIPNLFRRLFGEGALTAAFIPAYTTARQQDPELARRFSSLCLAVIAITLGLITILGELVLAGMLGLRNWTPDSSLAIKLTMVMLPYMPLVCIVAIVGSILQVHGRFAPSAGMPIFLNVVMIAGTWLALRGVREHDEAGLMNATFVVGIAVVVAGVIQLATQGGMMLRYERPTLQFAGTRDTFKAMISAFLPMLLALSVLQVNTAMDTFIALGLSPKEGGAEKLHLFGRVLDWPVEEGGVTMLNNASRLYQFPLGVFGLSIATAIFPALASASADNSDASRDRFRRILRQGLRLTVFIGLPASVGLVLIRVPICRTLLEHGKFTLEDSRAVGAVLAGYAPAIWAYSMTHVITRAFYAMKDAKTPLRVSVAMVILNFALNLILVWPLGAKGLAWSTAICAMLQNVLLLRVLRRYVEAPVDAYVVRGWMSTALLTAAMTAALWPITWLYPAETLSRTGCAIQLAVMVALGGAIILGGAWAMKSEEMTLVLRRRKAAA